MSRHTWIMLLALILLACTYETNTYVECTDNGDCTMNPAEGRGKLGWSQSGRITPGSTQDVVSLQANFPYSGSYVLQFEVSDTNTYALGERLALEAEITWSVHGNNVRRLVDCKNGLSIQGVAEGIDVKVRDRSTLLPGANSPIDVSMQVAPGTRAPVEQPPTLSQAPIFLAAGPSNQFVPIPRNAGVINFMILVAHPVLGTPIPAQTINAFQTNTGGTQLAFVEVFPDCCPDWIPVVNGATHLLIQAGAGAPSTVWAIVWGIDG